MSKTKIYITKILAKLFGKRFVLAGVPVIIKNSKGEILLGKRADDHVYYPGIWGLPGGMIDYGEKMQQAAVREIKEELGVQIKITKQGKAYDSLPTKECPLHTVDNAFYAKIVKGIPRPKDETKKVAWLKPSQIKPMKLAYGHKEILKGEGLLK